MKKIGVFMDVTSKSGGKLHMVISVCNYLKKIEGYDFIFITTFSTAKKILDDELKINCLLFDKNTIKNRVLNRLKKKFNFLPFYSPFESFLKKNKIELLYFLDSSPMVRSISNTSFIYTIFDIGHKNSETLPEYNSIEISNREKDYKIGGEKSKKIIVGTNKLKEQLISNYNVRHNKVEILKFPPPITNLESKKVSKENLKIYGIIKNINYIIYPAQFWKHKNHSYVVEAANFIKNNSQLNFKFIFTGYDKGNLQNIKNLIKKLEMENDFIILDYVNNDELYYLYQNCSAVIVPTLVAPHTFPLYEAFFFKKPIFYNSKILDPEFKNNIIELDVNDISDLGMKIKILENKTLIKKMTENNFENFIQFFNDEKIIKNLKKIISESLDSNGN